MTFMGKAFSCIVLLLGVFGDAQAVDSTTLKKQSFYITYMTTVASQANVCPEPSSPPTATVTLGSSVTANTLDGKPEYLWQCQVDLTTLPAAGEFPPDTPDTIKSIPISQSPVPEDWAKDSANNYFTYYQFPENRFVPTIFTGTGMMCEKNNKAANCTGGTDAFSSVPSPHGQLIVSSKAGISNISCFITGGTCKGTVNVKVGTITTMQCCDNTQNGGPWACQKDMHDVSRWDGTFTACGGGSSWMCPTPLTRCQ